MRKALPYVLALMAFAIVLLVLNLREIDDYEFGTETIPAPGINVSPDDYALRVLFPDLKFVHACPSCGECVHPFEILANHRVMSIHDHDGWYKLFWAGDDEYYYDDPVHMLADWGKNSSAESMAGFWTIRLRTQPPTHGPAPQHDCGRIPADFTLTYELVASEAPLEEQVHPGEGPLKVLQSFPWLTANSGHPLSLGWRSSASPRSPRPSAPAPSHDSPQPAAPPGRQI